MKKIRILIALIIFILLTKSTYSQPSGSINIVLYSIENKLSKINLCLDELNEKIIINLSSSESLCINGFKDLTEEIKVIKRKFLLFKFRIRGGTGVALRRSVLVCISNDRLFKVFDVLSMVRSQCKENYIPKVDSLNEFDENHNYQ